MSYQPPDDQTVRAALARLRMPDDVGEPAKELPPHLPPETRRYLADWGRSLQDAAPEDVSPAEAGAAMLTALELTDELERQMAELRTERERLDRRTRALTRRERELADQADQLELGQVLLREQRRRIDTSTQRLDTGWLLVKGFGAAVALGVLILICLTPRGGS